MSENTTLEKRLELHEKLCNLIGSRKRVYFQPPESLKISYPCIIYSRKSGNDAYADNKIYQHMTQYQVMVVDEDPDSDLLDKIRNEFMYCSSGTTFVSDGLNHDPFTIYY